MSLRPALGKKVLNEKKNMFNVGKNANNNMNNYINNKNDNKNNIKIEKTGGTKKDKGKTNDYINNVPVTLKPIVNSNDNNNSKLKHK